MAKGGGRMSFTGGTYNAGRIVIDANEALKSANDLDAALQRVGSTLTNLSKGRDVSTLWNAQAASIENVVQALEQFRRNTESVGNAEGLVKAMNAFSAWHPDENISSYFDRMGDGAQALIDKAKQLAVNLDSAFDVSSLREAFQVFEMLKSAGVDLEQIFAKLGAGDVSTLTQQVETLERQLTRTRYRAQELQDQVDQFQSGDAFAEMQEKINQYESAMERAKSEFRSFLSASGFAGYDLDEYYGRFSDLFERIGNGSLTVKEAMAQVREEYSHMFQSAGADQILEIMTRLESLGTALEGIKETLSNMGMANSGSASLGEMREYLAQGADAAAHQREELAQLSAQSASLQGLIDVLVRLSQANAEADTGMAGVHQSIVELLSSVQSLGQIDVGNLQQVSDILRSFVKMDGISVGKASVQNLVSAFESLSRLPSTSSLSGLAAIDFSNLSNLKVSKAALSNLAEFLPSISGINVGPLQQLASIDWTNLSNLKVSKASLSNLSEMAQTTGLSPDTSGFTSVQSAIDKIGTSLDGLQEKIRTTFDLSNAISQASELASQYANVKAALDTAASAGAKTGSASATGGSGTAGSGEANIAYIQQLIKMQEQLSVWIAKNGSAYAQNKQTIDAFASAIQTTISNLQATIDGYSNEIQQAGVVTEGTIQGLRTSLLQITGDAAAQSAIEHEAEKAASALQREEEAAWRVHDAIEAAEATKQSQMNSDWNKSEESARRAADAVEQATRREIDAWYQAEDAADRAAEANARAIRSIIQHNISSDGAKALDEIIAKYKEYYDLQSKKIGAVHTGKIDDADYYRARAAAIEELIAKIEVLLPDLTDQAKRSDEVVAAIERYNNAVTKGQNAADSAMAARAEKEAAALEKYKQQLESLSQLNVTGKNAIQFTGDETSVERYKAALAELQAKFDAIGVASEGARAQAVADFDAQRQKVEELRESLNQAAKDQSAANNLANKIELYASKNGAAPLAIRQQWQQWINELRSGDAVARGVLNNIKAGFASTAKQIRITNNGGKTFFQTLKEGWSKFGGWSIVTRSFTKVISLFKEAVTAVKDVDSAMTELKKVTNLTSVEYDRFYENATKMAGKVGSSLADTINAVADFSRVGFEIDIAQDLAEASLVYQNVADGLEGVEAATSSLISTIKAFGEETYTAMGIVDMFNEVGNNFAISSAGIGEALQRSASSLATAGNTLEESIGLIVAANDVVQNPESVGENLRPAA